MRRDREEALSNGLDEVELNDNDYVDFREAIENDIELDTSLGEEEDE